jgi:hypothetical protein
VNLDNYKMILKMLINGKISTPFKMDLLMHEKGKPEIIEAIKKISKLKYSRTKAIVEEEISQRSFVEPPSVQPVTPPPVIPPKK